MNEETEYAIVGECGFEGFWEPACMLRGYEQSLIDLVTELIRKAAARPKPRRRTRPTLASKRRRLEDKRRRGEKKRPRRPVPPSED
ncbi:MAG: hypothetical protein WBH57_11205 [Anaerolineae bacterium]